MRLLGLSHLCVALCIAASWTAQAHELRWKEAPLALAVPGTAAEWKVGGSKASEDAERVTHSATGLGARAGWTAELVEFQGLPRDPAIALQQALVPLKAVVGGREDWAEKAPGHEGEVEFRFAAGARFAAKSWVFDNTNVVVILRFPPDAPSARADALSALGSRGKAAEAEPTTAAAPPAASPASPPTQR